MRNGIPGPEDAQTSAHVSVKAGASIMTSGVVDNCAVELRFAYGKACGLWLFYRGKDRSAWGTVIRTGTFLWNGVRAKASQCADDVSSFKQGPSGGASP